MAQSKNTNNKKYKVLIKEWRTKIIYIHFYNNQLHRFIVLDHSK